ncbi:MAG: DNA polymerase II [Candidatus Omnitrophica bacterium CG11_big_fil_rev_8_21_14_0_20_64_10]|nr:MAG: DNA polymerase II [Candidatus Omnitrophica bacterium CG11_big_fil_rev_8_21_14_0_20_64_10]
MSSPDRSLDEPDPLERTVPNASEALEVIEAARESKWERPSFAAGLFLGRVDPSLIFPYAAQSAEDQKVGDAFLAKLEPVLRKEVDPDEVDRTGELPAAAIQALAGLGCFGMKIPAEYGGLGLSQVNYNRAMALVSSYCGSTAVWLSAHQSIGVPQPLKMFGTDEQKKKYLPRLAKGEVSAFALTEPDVGSDPAKMSTTATPVDGGSAYLISGQKLWCTNGPVADLLVVMARTPDRVIRGKPRKQITAFIVEGKSAGLTVEHRCQFMGIRAIQNGLLKFKDVRVPKENILWGVGRGLKLALMTLNTGRLTLPAACVGASRRCLKIVQEWSLQRVQWGGPIGHHEAVAEKIGRMAADQFALEALVWLTSAWADRGDMDIRIEAAVAKLFGSESVWNTVDQTLQIRGGRGYETAQSLRGRGEKGIPVERIFRDMRINRIIEGTSEVMHLFIAREALDPHLQLGFDVILPGVAPAKRMKAMVRAGLFYAGWYPMQWLPGFLSARPAGLPGELAGHWRSVVGLSHRLARTLFHQMVRHRQGLEKRQVLLNRLVDVGVELFAMSAALSRAAWMAGQGKPEAVELAGLFCEQAKVRILRNFKELYNPADRPGMRGARRFLEGAYPWLEEEMID